mmetsp:Transcript_10113/g.11523  ORF Transcript_10113/g.11523 Transcript_10113/m.11523 type:complete len:161 (+) Transcript_10113:262-744(+)|eukprot:CAMPEP_0205811640 /NCGR_PEP_ID=MMETSP0205-20121125/15883_1 /ASSEMBLY_ACC=CAM_ASM_000278 /TAXON_ID=36767 /ORGANISM="Euplotes focardii, Strain TN1" /LENGTH=160 /DNA_ID=CAMNT_0053091099 /DNA_START=212 /DNA_END=694 /DNA_ORIENTATION=-
MKAYHLIRKDPYTNHEISEVDTVNDHFHQDHEGSLHESSEVVANTAKFSLATRTKTTKKCRKTMGSNDESDSDFELPPYSTKNMVQGERTFRSRKNLILGQLEGDLDIQNCSAEEGDSVTRDEEVKTFKEPVGSFEVNQVLTSKKKLRKVSTDSTHEGSL